MKRAIQNFDSNERARRLKATVALLAVVTVPPAGLRVAGQYRYDMDRRWCSYGSASDPKKLIVNQSCVEQRQDGRWGPFLSFGTSTRGKTRN